MTGIMPARRIERRGNTHPAVPASRGSTDTGLIRLDEFRAEMACGQGPASADEEQIGPYEEGFAAFDSAMGLADNPYPADSCAHLHWANGWSQARDEAQRQAR